MSRFGANHVLATTRAFASVTFTSLARITAIHTTNQTLSSSIGGEANAPTVAAPPDGLACG
jgi:hypothetical protein